MKYFVTGGRDHKITPGEFYDFGCLLMADLPDSVHHGNCRGVDREAAKYAEELGFEAVPHPAEWTNAEGEYNPKAGFERNDLMASLGEAGDILAAFPGGNGTADMVRRWREKGHSVIEIRNVSMFRRPY